MKNEMEKICGELAEEVEETMKLMGQVVKIGRKYRDTKEWATKVAENRLNVTNVPNVGSLFEPSSKTMRLQGESEMKRALAGKVTSPCGLPNTLCWAKNRDHVIIVNNIVNWKR